MLSPRDARDGEPGRASKKRSKIKKNEEEMNNTIRTMAMLQLMLMGINALQLPQDILANWVSDAVTRAQLGYAWDIVGGLYWAILLMTVCIQHQRWAVTWSCSLLVLMGMLYFILGISGAIEAGALMTLLEYIGLSQLAFWTALPLVIWGRGPCPQMMGLTLCGYAIFGAMEDISHLFSAQWYELEFARFIGDLLHALGDGTGLMATAFRLLAMVFVIIGIDTEYKTKKEIE